MNDKKGGGNSSANVTSHPFTFDFELEKNSRRKRNRHAHHSLQPSHTRASEGASMTRVRGDDELMELLGMMGGVDPKEGKVATTKAGAGVSLKKATTHPEVVCVPETGWNSSIWNPNVSNNAAATAATAAVEGLAGGAVDNGAGAGGVGEWGLGVEGGGALEGGRGIKLVSPQEEVLRQQAVATVFSRFQVLGKELGIRAKNEMFERWQFSQKLREGRGGDPILPAKAFFDPALDAELQELGVHKTQARNLCCELGRASKSSLKTLTRQLRVGVGSSSKRVVAKRPDGSTYILQLGKNRLRMNSAHYEKMRELFRRTRGYEESPASGRTPSGGGSGGGGGGSDGGINHGSGWIAEFHDCLFACLMRYEALQGGGFQASMDGDAFDVLLRRFGVQMECFASPFNCRYGRYCSAFADTDMPFGSLGSFFDFRPTEGAFEANPPFVRDVILKMANHMDDLLKATSKALTFVVIIPNWEDAEGWARLRNSPFLTKQLKIDQKDHSYCEGKQHLRRNRYRLASFHTAVFFLQTAAARQASPVTQQACDDLKHAFAPKQEEGGAGAGAGAVVVPVTGGRGNGNGGGSDTGDGVGTGFRTVNGGGNGTGSGDGGSSGTGVGNGIGNGIGSGSGNETGGRDGIGEDDASDDSGDHDGDHDSDNDDDNDHNDNKADDDKDNADDNDNNDDTDDDDDNTNTKNDQGVTSASKSVPRLKSHSKSKSKLGAKTNSKSASGSGSTPPPEKRKNKRSFFSGDGVREQKTRAPLGSSTEAVAEEGSGKELPEGIKEVTEKTSKRKKKRKKEKKEKRDGDGGGGGGGREKREVVGGKMSVKSMNGESGAKEMPGGRVEGTGKGETRKKSRREKKENRDGDGGGGGGGGGAGGGGENKEVVGGGGSVKNNNRESGAKEMPEGRVENPGEGEKRKKSRREKKEKRDGDGGSGGGGGGDSGGGEKKEVVGGGGSVKTINGESGAKEMPEGRVEGAGKGEKRKKKKKKKNEKSKKKRESDRRRDDGGSDDGDDDDGGGGGGRSGGGGGGGGDKGVAEKKKLLGKRSSAGIGIKRSNGVKRLRKV
eukprot:jgi/Undpi1/2026/HiC_scaffold_12.g05412.m1